MRRGPAVVAGAGAVVLLVGSAVFPRVNAAPEPPAVKVQPVESTRLVCADPAGSPIAESTVTAFVAPGIGAKGDATGSARIATLPTKGAGEAQGIDEAGVPESFSTSGSSLPPVVATGAGSLAPGLVLDQFTLGSQGKSRGLGALSCFAAGTDQWFVGGGAGVGRTSVITLANPEATAAIADVLLFGPTGALPAPAGRGVLIPARGQSRLSLTALAPGVPDFVVHVTTRSGRVVAAVGDQEVNGLIPRGVDWVPQVAAPSSRVVVVGIPGKVTPVRLSVLSPLRDATVKVRLLTPSGSYSPTGVTTITLTAGQVEVVDITKALREQPAAVELVSDGAIIAGARYQLGSETGVAEFAYAADAPPLTGPAGVAGLPTTAGYRHRLYLTNIDQTRDSSVVVALIGVNRKVVRTTLKVPRGTTQVWTAKPPAGATFSMVVVPAKGAPPVRAARVSSLPATQGTMATGVPLVPIRSTVTVPQAQPDLGVTVG